MRRFGIFYKKRDAATPAASPAVMCAQQTRLRHKHQVLLLFFCSTFIIIIVQMNNDSAQMVRAIRANVFDSRLNICVLSIFIAQLLKEEKMRFRRSGFIRVPDRYKPNMCTIIECIDIPCAKYKSHILVKRRSQCLSIKVVAI